MTLLSRSRWRGTARGPAPGGTKPVSPEDCTSTDASRPAPPGPTGRSRTTH